jgi:hypothetical protein
MSQTRTASATYTATDIENVVRRVKADLIMIADSTGGWAPEKAAGYAHDVDVLAKAGYLAWVDVTLLSNEVEIKAVRFDVDTAAGSLTTSRPGGVKWPKVSSARLRLVIGYTDAYTNEAREAIKKNLKTNWSTNYESISHAGMSSVGGRNYVSNAYGMQRKDWAA